MLGGSVSSDFPDLPDDPDLATFRNIVIFSPGRSRSKCQFGVCESSFDDFLDSVMAERGGFLLWRALAWSWEVFWVVWRALM